MSTPTPGLETIVAYAVELDTDSTRDAYLDRICEGNLELRKQVDALIRAHFEAGSFFTPGDNVATVTYHADEIPSRVIGPYKLLQQIGEGGMGSVFMAEQTHPIHRKVALKIIKPGMDSKQIIARFEAERQALAMMNHTNIARVLDAGAIETGRPYFVMELVQGIPITKYCDDNHLTPRERLELFIPVCRAIQHAHQKGIIHRDVKPSNVLVTLYDGRPEPKVIDFGIAKATEQNLTDRTLFTNFGTLVGTLEYMSPEQAEMSALGVDTRSDVYSLGVLLYELLTGVTPLDGRTLRGAAFAEMVRIIREVDPLSPSQKLSTSGDALSAISSARKTEPGRLTKMVRGELDWIVMKALEKDRNRRYESASDFAADIEHYLQDEPVKACPPSSAYRLRKYAERNRMAFISSFLVLAALGAGSVISIWKYFDERSARREADKQRVVAVHNADEADRQAREAHIAQADAVNARRDAEQKRNEVSRNLYFADMRLALSDWNSGNLGRLSRMLQSHLPGNNQELRGWEWYFLQALCHQDEWTFRNKDQVSCIAWSPDGQSVATTSRDGIVCVRNAKSWDVTRVHRLSSDYKIGLAWSPDSKRLVWSSTSGEKPIEVWQVGTDEVKSLRGHSASVWTVGWHPNGQWLASAGIDGTARIWDVESGACIQVLKCLDGNCRHLSWSPDGARLAIVHTEDGGVCIWETTNWQLVREALESDNSWSMAWKPDGQQIAIGTKEGLCVLYRTDDWSEVKRWRAHLSAVNHLDWNKNGNRLASAGSDNIIKLWKNDGSCDSILHGHSKMVNAVAWEPSGNRLVSASMDHTVRVWSGSPHAVPRRIPIRSGKTPVLAWGESPGTLLVFEPSHGSVTTINTMTWQELRKSETQKGPFGLISTPGKRIVIEEKGSERTQLMLTDRGTGERMRLPCNWTKGVGEFSPNGSQLVLTQLQSLTVMDLERNQAIFTQKCNGFFEPAWSPHGNQLAVIGFGQSTDRGDTAWAGWVYLYDVPQNKLIFKVLHGADGVLPTAIAWSLDAKRLVSGSRDGLIEIREVPGGKKTISAQIHQGPVRSLAWSPDGRRVASGSQDETVRIWDPESGEELLRFDTPTAVVQKLLWSADGLQLVAACDDGSILVWDASPGYRFVSSPEYVRDQLHSNHKKTP